MAWVKRQSSATNQNTSARIVSDEHPRGLAQNDGFAFGFTGADGQLAVRVNDHLSATSVTGGLIPPTEGNWHHIAVTYDGTLPGTNALTRNVHFYVDGAQRGDGNVLASQIVETNGNPMRVGNAAESPSQTGLLVGKIDDVRILRDYAPAAVGNGNISSVISCYMNHNEGGGLAAPQITAPASVCANSTGNAASIADYGAGAAYTWQIGNGSITGGQGTPAITWSASSASPVTLSVSVTANGCTASATKDVTVTTSGSVTITAPDSVCANSTGNTASIPDAGAGATYSWTIQNGTITAGQASRSITWSANSATPVSLSITVSGVGCGLTGSKDVVVNALPDATITAPSSVCANSTGNSASVPDAGQGATYSWTISGGTIQSGGGTRSITWSAGSSSPVSLSATVTANGCAATGNKDVTVGSSGSVTITASDSVCANSTGNTASVPDAGTGATYSWTIQNGTITTGQGTRSITWSAASTSPVSLLITVAGVGCGSTGSKNVTVNALPDATVTAPDSVCANSTGNAASVPDAGSGATYNWSLSNGTITGGQGTRSITWSAGLSSPAALSVTVTVNGCASSGSKNVTVASSGSVTITAPDSVCANSTGNTASVLDAGAGATYTWTIQNGTITAGQDTRSITWSATTASPATLGVTVASAGCSSVGTKDVTVNACGGIPTVQITSPAPGATISGTVSVETQAADDGAVSSITLLIDGNELVTLTDAPFTFVLDTRLFANGAHTISARVADNAGVTRLGGDPDAETVANEAESAPLQLVFQNNLTLTSFEAFQSQLPIQASLSYAQATWSIQIEAEDGTVMKNMSGTTSDGQIATTWDGTDNNGNDVPTKSLYFYTITATPTGLTAGSDTITAAAYREAPFTTRKTLLSREKLRRCCLPPTRFLWETVSAQKLVNIRTAISLSDANNETFPDDIFVADVDADWPALLGNLQNPEVTQFYYNGHTDGDGMGFNEGSPLSGLVYAEVATVLDNIYFFSPVKNTWVARFNTPFKFVFLDGCLSGKGNWPRAFGILKNQMDYSVVGRKNRAFLGWGQVTRSSLFGNSHDVFSQRFWQHWTEVIDRPMSDAIQQAINEASGIEDTQLVRYGFQNLTWQD